MNHFITERKRALRTEILSLRKSIDKEDFNSWNEGLKNQVLDLELVQNARSIHCYVSMKDQMEVDTWGMINQFLQLKKTVVVPIIELNHQLRHSKIETLDSLETNSWGVSEPKEIQEVDLETLDLIFVPMLSVDVNGNRLGYGKGFYDRFLMNISVPKLGLCFEKFVLDEIPTEEHDVKLDGIITEKHVRLLKHHH